jgi:hypothetical protein
MRTHVGRDVDSNCFGPNPDTEYEGDRCGEGATTYVRLPSGVSRYVCPDHAAEVDRFDDDGTDEDHPNVGVCERCRKLTPVEYIGTEDGTCVECTET